MADKSTVEERLTGTGYAVIFVYAFVLILGFMSAYSDRNLIERIETLETLHGVSQ